MMTPLALGCQRKAIKDNGLSTENSKYIQLETVYRAERCRTREVFCLGSVFMSYSII
jgi:hypothetical protein